MNPIIGTISARVEEAFRKTPFDFWTYFCHKDESYYVCNNDRPEKYMDFIEHNEKYLKKSTDSVRDEYFNLSVNLPQPIESIRLRLYNNNSESRIFLIVKLPDTLINTNLIREVCVFVFRTSEVMDTLYDEIKNTIYSTFNVESSFVIEKSRAKYTLFDELKIVDNQQVGSSLRVTVDKINNITDLSENKDLMYLLPSTLIVEFERPYYGWSEQAEQLYSEVTTRIIDSIPQRAILRKNQSKFCDIIPQ